MDKLPVEDVDGSALLTFDHLTEGDLTGLPASAPLTASLVVLWSSGRCLMVFNRFRRAWELPGGMIDPGESPREAAVRELAEESGQHPDSLTFAGVATIRVAPDQRIESLAIYRGELTSPRPFTPNAEMSAATWWNPTVPLPGLLPIDAALAHLCP